MPDIEFVRGEIERMRVQVQRQRNEISKLERRDTQHLGRGTARSHAHQD